MINEDNVQQFFASFKLFTALNLPCFLFDVILRIKI